MGIKYDSKNNSWIVSYSKRNPSTRVPCRMERRQIKIGSVKRNIASKAEAQKVYNELVVAVDKKIHAKIVPSWTRVVENFLANAIAQGYSHKSINNQRLCLAKHTQEAWGDTPIDSITSNQIRDLICIRMANYSDNHRNNLRKMINAVFKFALGDNLIAKNPVPDIKIKSRDKIKCVLTESQASTLLERAKINYSIWYPHWCMALFTGMRSGELYALTWDKVNFDSRQILVNSSWNNKDGFKGTKSGDDRIVEIAHPLLHILKELKLSNQGSDFVLPRIGKWEKGEQAKELKNFLTINGLPEVKFHDLRATWATLMLSKGTPAIKVMTMGGWKELKTMEIYIRQAGVDIKGITDSLDLHNPKMQSANIISLA